MKLRFLHHNCSLTNTQYEGELLLLSSLFKKKKNKYKYISEQIWANMLVDAIINQKFSTCQLQILNLNKKKKSLNFVENLRRNKKVIINCSLICL